MQWCLKEIWVLGPEYAVEKTETVEQSGVSMLEKDNDINKPGITFEKQLK